MRIVQRAPVVLFFALLAPAPLPAQTVAHPLDGLATSEYWVVYDALQSAGHLTPETRFTSVLLHPPAKATVLSWKPGAPFPREAGVRGLAGDADHVARVPHPPLPLLSEESGARSAEEPEHAMR